MLLVDNGSKWIVKISLIVVTVFLLWRSELMPEPMDHDRTGADSTRPQLSERVGRTTGGEALQTEAKHEHRVVRTKVIDGSSEHVRVVFAVRGARKIGRRRYSVIKRRHRVYFLRRFQKICFPNTCLKGSHAQVASTSLHERIFLESMANSEEKHQRCTSSRVQLFRKRDQFGHAWSQHKRRHTVADPDMYPHTIPTQFGKLGVRHRKIVSRSTEKVRLKSRCHLRILDGTFILLGIFGTALIAALTWSTTSTRRIPVTAYLYTAFPQWVESRPMLQESVILCGYASIVQSTTLCGYVSVGDDSIAKGSQCARVLQNRCALHQCYERSTSISCVGFSLTRRFGEALNPGPYHVGGASSSASGAPQQEEAGLTDLEQYGPFPVRYSDADIMHRFGVQWLHASDVEPFLRDELYGETWDRSAMLRAMRQFALSGQGIIDPAKLIVGPSEYANFVPPPSEYQEVARPYDWCPLVSEKQDPKDLALSFLRGKGGCQCSAASVAALVASHCNGERPPAPDYPLIEEDRLVPENFPTFSESMAVGPARLPVYNRSKAGRRSQNRGCPIDGSVFRSLPSCHGVATKMQRPRQKRRPNSTFDILLVNSSGRPQFAAALQSCGQRVKVILNQEHQAAGPQFVDLQHDASRVGWKVQGAQAKCTPKGGRSAGTAVACRKPVGMGDIHGSFDHSPSSSPGRVSAAWLQVGPPTGVVVVSVYLHTNECMTVRNRSLLTHAVALATGTGSPWIVGGDFNMTPDEVGEGASNLLEKANAYIVATGRPTHHPGSGLPRTLDFVICSSLMRPWIEKVYIDDGINLAPHRAVGVTVRASVTNFLVRALRAPASFPRVKPIGCARAPVVPQWSTSPPPPSRERSSNGEGSGYASPSKACVAAQWPALVHAIETELCRITDNVDQYGYAAAQFAGRARGVSTAFKLALPMKASASIGKVDMDSHALMWLAIRVEELAAISAQIDDSKQVAHLAWRQWHGIMRKIRAPRGLVEQVRRISLDWLDIIRGLRRVAPGGDTEFLRCVARQARTQAKRRKSEVAGFRSASWKKFVASQLKNGAAITHRLTKRDGASINDTATVSREHGRSAAAQDVVEHDLREWRAIWTRLGDKPTAPWRSEDVASDELPPLGGNDIVKAAASFSSTTSVGCDTVPPRAMSWVSDRLALDIATFLNGVEATGAWPAEVATALVHLIPKPDTGRRPIGVLPSIVRVWERSRKAAVQKWLRVNKFEFDWATQGRSAEAAAWHQALMDEAATAQSLVSATAFVDLTKAFENVRLEDVWRSGRHYGFPLQILRPALEAFTFARRLCYHKAVTDPVYTLSAILAGGGFAQVALLLVLVHPLELLARKQVGRTLTMTLCFYVDDIAIHCIGGQEEVVQCMAQATEQLVDHLEGQLLMQVSRRERWASDGKGKTVVTASSQAALRRLSTPMRRLGIQLKNKAKHLGVVFTPGARTRQGAKTASRWADNAQRAARTLRLSRRLGRHVFRTGLTPAVLYGTSVAMPKITTVASMRRAASRVFGRIGGGSTLARLTINQADPAWEAVRRSVWAWATAVWNESVDRDLMQRAWQHAVRESIKSRAPSISSGGAAGAFIDAISRVDWTSPSYRAVKTIDGTILLLDQVPPKTLVRHLQDDFQIVTASASKLADRLNRQSDLASCGDAGAEYDSNDKFVRYNGKLVPWLEPIAQLLNSKWAKTQPPAAIASAASLAEGGWWPQARLFEEGLAADPICRACLVAPGTLLHRLLHCHERTSFMEAHCPRWLTQTASDNSSDPLFSEGIPRLPVMPSPPPPHESWIGTVPAAGAVAYGVAYTDGALRGTIPKSRRAGWAFTVAQDDAKLWGKFGVCNEQYTSVLRAELRALAEVLRIACGPLTVHVDNAQVVDGVRHGKEWCLDAKREGADIWREIWAILPGLENVRVVKVKAHLSYRDVEEGRIPFAHWVGNGVADQWAKVGCETACTASPYQWSQTHWKRAQAWYRWVVKVATEWVTDTAMSGPIQPPGRSKGAVAGNVETMPQSAAQHFESHELWRNSEMVWCRRCDKKAASKRIDRPPAIFKAPCRGTMAQRCGLRVPGIVYDRAVYDDGAVPLAFLHGQMAERWVFDAHLRDSMPLPTASAVPMTVAVPANVAPDDSDSYPMAEVMSEDDPFGHLQCDMDNVPLPVCGHVTGEDWTVSPVSVVHGVRVPSDSAVQHPPPEHPLPGAQADHERREVRVHVSHRLRRTAHVIWCAACGRSAISRIGSGLSGMCRGTADGAYPKRIARLKAGLRPISGEPLHCEDFAHLL